VSLGGHKKSGLQEPAERLVVVAIAVVVLEDQMFRKNINHFGCVFLLIKDILDGSGFVKLSVKHN
jgi:hypothetical protein